MIFCLVLSHVFCSFADDISTPISYASLDAVLTGSCVGALEMLGVAKGARSGGWTAGFFFLRCESSSHGSDQRGLSFVLGMVEV